MKKVPGVDGLRAIAVIAVILFHAGFDWLPGGFAGVDVFFVISGYLVGGQLLNDFERGSFSLSGYLERRVRRLVPALLLVVFTTTLFAYWWMLPDDLENHGQAAVASLTFTNNLLLFLTTDYWALPAEFKPLLHTWSLGVEAQFYLLAPLLVALCWLLGQKGAVWGLAAVMLGSALLMPWHWDHWGSGTFYLPQTRLWEFLAGTLVAWWSRRPLLTARYALWLLMMGLAGILVSFVLLSQHVQTPGIWTLVPVGATAAALWGLGYDSFVRRCLESKPLQLIGLISYSLYLWHQPAFAFARVLSRQPPDSVSLMILMLPVVGLAYVTWRYVEQPFRRPAVVNRKTLGLLLPTTSVLIGLTGAWLHFSQGAAYRLGENTDGFTSGMHIAYNEQARTRVSESFAPDPTRSRVLVVGNSFARDAINMLSEAGLTTTSNIVYLESWTDCIDQNRLGDSADLLGAAQVIILAVRVPDETCVENNLSWAKEQRKRLVYLGPKHFGYNLNWMITLDERERASQCNIVPKEVLALDRRLAAVLPPENYLSLIEALSQNGCMPLADKRGRLLSVDRTHLTKAGARFFGHQIAPRLNLAAVAQ